MVDMAFGVGEDGEVLAIMPGVAATVGRPDCMTCYAHMGQHSSCVIQYCNEHLRPAEYGEFKDLYDELERIGYPIRVVPFGTIDSNDYLTMRREELNYDG